MKKILAILLVLAFGVFAHAQYIDMQRGTDVIRPNITNELSHLGAAYTLGSDPGNLTGEYGKYMQLRLSEKRNPSDIRVELLFFEADGTPAMVDLGNGNYASEIDLSLEFGMSSTFGQDANFSFIIDSDKLLYQLSCWENTFDEKIMINTDAIGAIGGYVDYFAVSGSTNVKLSQYTQFGNGWINDQDEYGFVDMQRIRVPGFVIFNPFTFGDPGYTLTSSKALAWNAETGVAISGSFATGGSLGLLGWNNLTFTFGSFERHPVPEPATLVMLGLAAAGIPVVRRLRRG